MLDLIIWKIYVGSINVENPWWIQYGKSIVDLIIWKIHGGSNNKENT